MYLFLKAQRHIQWFLSCMIYVISYIHAHHDGDKHIAVWPNEWSIIRKVVLALDQPRFLDIVYECWRTVKSQVSNMVPRPLGTGHHVFMYLLYWDLRPLGKTLKLKAKTHQLTRNCHIDVSIQKVRICFQVTLLQTDSLKKIPTITTRTWQAQSVHLMSTTLCTVRPAHYHWLHEQGDTSRDPFYATPCYILKTIIISYQHKTAWVQ